MSAVSFFSQLCVLHNAFQNMCSLLTITRGRYGVTWPSEESFRDHCAITHMPTGEVEELGSLHEMPGRLAAHLHDREALLALWSTRNDNKGGGRRRA